MFVSGTGSTRTESEEKAIFVSGILEDEHGNYRRCIVKVLESSSQPGGFC